MALFVPRDRTSLFRQFLAGMYDAVIITDPSGHILEINARAEEFFSFVLDEVIDHPVSDLIPGLSSDVVVRIRRGLGEDRHVVIDANGRNKSGEKFACEVAISVIDLMNPGNLVFTVRNTERRRKINNMFRAKSNAFQIAQCALFACDLEGRIRDVNEQFLEMFGLKDEEDAQRHMFADLMPDEPLLANFQKALDGERTVTEIIADGDDDDQSALEIVLAPNMHGRKCHGVVGSILRV